MLYFIANNNVNSAQWLPILYRDMVTLDEKHPQLVQEFQRGIELTVFSNNY